MSRLGWVMLSAGIVVAAAAVAVAVDATVQSRPGHVIATKLATAGARLAPTAAPHTESAEISKSQVVAPVAATPEPGAEAEAFYRAGVVYADSDSGFEHDYFSARDAFEKAAKLGHRDAMFRLGVLAEFHRGGLSIKDASAWYEAAAALGHADAAYRRSKWGDRLEWLEKARMLGSPEATFEIARRNKDGPGIMHAADLGSVEAQSYLGRLYQYGGLGFPRDQSQAIIWYKLAAECGDEQANRALRVLGVR